MVRPRPARSQWGAPALPEGRHRAAPAAGMVGEYEMAPGRSLRITLEDGTRIYHAGDTERIPEMQVFSCDVAMLPLGQRFTMTSVQEAVNAALDLLIDGERGIWHLANIGATSWADLARRVAQRVSLVGPPWS